MTVYVDDFRVLATVGRVKGRWSHLTADTREELHAFADQLGLQRVWFQQKDGPDGVLWHYDVTDRIRTRAIAHGATPIDLRAMGALISARRAAHRHSAAAASTPASKESRS